MTQKDLVISTGISKNTISRIETGDTTADISQLSLIANALEVSIETLLKSRCEVISCINQKGGVGKSTIIGLMSVHVKSRYPHKKILVVDTDPQTSMNVLDRGNENIVDIVKFNYLKHDNPIMEFLDLIEGKKKYYDFIFIDTPGAFNQNDFISMVAELSSLVLIPLMANEMSIAGSMVSINLVKSAHLRRSKKGLQSNCRIVINHMKPNLLESKQIRAVEKLSEMKIFKTAISDRVRYVRDLNFSEELVDKKASDEVNDFLNEVFKFIRI